MELFDFVLTQYTRRLLNKNNSYQKWATLFSTYTKFIIRHVLIPFLINPTLV